MKFRFNLFQNPYVDSVRERQAEFAHCRKTNKSLPHVNIIDVMPNERANIADLLRAAQKTGWSDINVIANSDLTWEDSSVELLTHIGYGECFCLSRYNEASLQTGSEGSHDAWVFRGPPPMVAADFPLGKWGCDNRLAKLLFDAGLSLYNPCKSIIIHHHHASNVRRTSRANRVQGEYLQVPPCAINEIRLGKNERTLTPEKLAIVLLGRLGDICNAIPAVYDLVRQGHSVDWYVGKEFVQFIAAVPYVNAIAFEGTPDDLSAAYRLAAAIDGSGAMKYDRVVCPQVHRNIFPLKIKTASYSTDSWKLGGFPLDKYQQLPLVLDEPEFPEIEDTQNLIAICTDSISSPHGQAQSLSNHLVSSLRKLGVTIYDIGKPPLPNPAMLFGVLRQCKALITIDTFPLHAAYATGTPTIAITADGWNGSAPRRHWVERLSYGESTTAQGRDKIICAVESALKGECEPGRLIHRAEPSTSAPTVIVGNPDVPGWGKLLSIMVPTIRGRESFLSRLRGILEPQIAPEADAVELVVDCDEGQISIGSKRNRLLNAARGEWCVFVDDDDVVDPSYVRLVLAELRKHAPDCIGYKVSRLESRSVNGHHEMVKIGVAIHSLNFKADSQRNRGNGFKEFDKVIRHINPMRTWIAKQIGFKTEGPEADLGEDVDFAKRLAASGLLKVQRFVDREMYTYELRSPEERAGEITHAKRSSETVTASINRGVSTQGN